MEGNVDVHSCTCKKIWAPVPDYWAPAARLELSFEATACPLKEHQALQRGPYDGAVVTLRGDWPGASAGLQ